jgi:hypothetical protein
MSANAESGSASAAQSITQFRRATVISRHCNESTLLPFVPFVIRSTARVFYRSYRAAQLSRIHQKLLTRFATRKDDADFVFGETLPVILKCVYITS